MTTNWRLPTYSPTSLNQHAACPEAFLHERVLKTPPANDEDSDALLKGSATHALLDRYLGFDATARTRFTANLDAETARALTAQGMVDASVGHDAVAEMVAWVTTGIDVLKTEFADARILIGEQFLDLHRPADPVPFRLTAKIDLLALFPDGSVESLDWKTGARQSLDQLQNVICRLVTEANVGRLLGPTCQAVGRPRSGRRSATSGPGPWRCRSSTSHS